MRALTVLHFYNSINEEHSMLENKSIFPLTIFSFCPTMSISEHRNNYHKENLHVC